MFLHRVLAALALCLFAALPSQAKGLFIINTGDEMFEVANFPADVIQTHPAAKDYKAGYKCSHFGVLWADVWTWDCKLVAVTGENSYSDLPDDVAAKLAGDPQYAMSKTQRNFWNKYAFWLLSIAGIAFFAYSKLGGKKKEQPQPAPEAAA